MSASEPGSWPVVRYGAREWSVDDDVDHGMRIRGDARAHARTAELVTGEGHDLQPLQGVLVVQLAQLLWVACVV